jgi:hypothetical protein
MLSGNLTVIFLLAVLSAVIQHANGTVVMVKMCQLADCSGECLSPRAQTAGACFSLHGTVQTETVTCLGNSSSSAAVCAAVTVFATEDKQCMGVPLSSTNAVCGSCVSLGSSGAGKVQLQCNSQEGWSLGVNCTAATFSVQCNDCAATVPISPSKSCQFVAGVGNVRVSSAVPCQTLRLSLYNRIYCQGPASYALLPNGGCLQGTSYVCAP